MNIFKAYDIRGIYPSQLNEEIARRIGYAWGKLLKDKGKVVVGYDIRKHSLSIKDSFINGLCSSGQDVILIGLCSTPMMNFATSFLNAIGGTMITASHNSKEWNGFKFCGQASSPIGYDSGINQIEQFVTSSQSIEKAQNLGSQEEYDISKDYAQAVCKKIPLFTKKPRLVIDYANAMGIAEVAGILDYFEVYPLYDNYDGDFPSHEANPLKTSTLKDLQNEVIKQNADFGISLDGDADRCGFVDEQGQVIPMDIITALLAEEILQTRKGTVVYDIRSSKVVPEIIKANGGTPIKSAVGHSKMKDALKNNKAIFGGELSGHYYFPEFANCESQAFAVLLIGQIIAKRQKRLSQIIKPLIKYAKSEEINFQVPCTKTVIEKIRNHYLNYKKEFIDGTTILADNWWFNIRSSNTEPLLRINIEANSQKTLEKITSHLTKLIKS